MWLTVSSSRPSGDGKDSTFECHVSEPWIAPFAYGPADPEPQHRCTARHVQISGDPPVLHAFVQASSERERMQRIWTQRESAVQFHMHTMDLPLVVHDEPLPPCAKRVDEALAFSLPDLGNLYHTFFDLLVPLQDTIASLNLSDPTLLALHNPIITRAQPWLTPIRFDGNGRPSASAERSFFNGGDSWNIESEAPVDTCRLGEGNGRAAYQFLDYLGALASPTYTWLTARPLDFPDSLKTLRQHQKCLRQFELHRQDGLPQIVLPVPDVFDADGQSLCVDEMHLNLRLRSSLWQYEGTAMRSDAHAFIFSAFRSLFRERIPNQLGLYPPTFPARSA